jgi:hypothetical protein
MTMALSYMDRMMVERMPTGLNLGRTLDGSHAWPRDFERETERQFVARVREEAAALGVKRVEFVGILEV